MNVPLANMFRYNRWATLTLLDACRELTGEQLDVRQPWTSGSIREIFLHLIGGQQTFVLRTKGRQHEGELNRSSKWPGFDALMEIATSTSDELVSIAESLDEDADVSLPFMGKVYHYPKSFFLVHAVEHGVEHRTEIKLALAAIGIATPDLDAWEFAASMGYGEDVTER
jgi:uncharacterized damage-inducible protein DinB